MTGHKLEHKECEHIIGVDKRRHAVTGAKP